MHLVCCQVHGRHQRSFFDLVRIRNPTFQIVCCIVCGSGGNRLPARQMSQVWPELPMCGCARNRMAIHACLRFKLVPPSRNRGILDAWLLFLLHPCGKLLRRIDVDTQQHLRVLHAAELRALSFIKTWRMGIDPHFVDAVRQQVDFAGKPRNPERMDHICRRELHKCRPRGACIADWDVQLIRRCDVLCWIAKLPPELVPDHRYFQCRRRFRRILDREDHPRRRQEHHHHDEYRNDGPGKLDLVAPEYLRRLAAIVIRSPPEAHSCIKNK